MATVLFDQKDGFSNPTVQILSIPRSLFANITQSSTTGLVTWVFNTPALGLVYNEFSLNGTQSTGLQSYASSSLTSYLSVLAAKLSGTVADVGYTQFSLGQLACGPSSSSVCFVEPTFFDVTADFYIEYAFARNTTTYFQSFVAGDSTSASTLLTSAEVSALFSYLEGTGSPSTPNTKYQNYLYAAYIYQSVLSTASGVFATRKPLEWLSGFNDTGLAAVTSTNTNYALDPDGVSTSITSKTGSDSVKNGEPVRFIVFLAYSIVKFYFIEAYILEAVNGNAASNVYGVTINVQNLYTYDVIITSHYNCYCYYYFVCPQLLTPVFFFFFTSFSREFPRLSFPPARRLFSLTPFC